MAGVSHQALSKVLTVTHKGGNLKLSGLAEYLIKKGVQSGNLERFSIDGIPDWVNHHIITYYALFAKQNCTKQAALSLDS
ncbi:MAG: hypothetical protein F6J98_14010 [Moorea sp. SIO4G2]|nr:hypothetical protein [Moorena sp. SIO4G2]